LCAAILAKIHEQLERSDHLLRLWPGDRLDWTPPISGAWPADVLIGHLLDCVAGVCAVLCAAEPGRLAHFAELRKLPVNHRCSPGEAAGRIAIYRAHIDQGFALIQDADLGRRMPCC
jgi:hypothetical protein